MQKAGGTPNAGLLDQRLAIDWVAENIGLFGGDQEHITLMGQSSGGGSTTFQLTAYGGEKPLPFHQAIIQSPGMSINANATTQDATASQFFELLNVTTLDEARALDSEAIIQANLMQITTAPYGSGLYGPVIDGDFITAPPAKLLPNITKLPIMVGHTANEGPAFSPPFVRDDASLRAYAAAYFGAVPSQILDYVVEVLYPAVYNGSYPWRTPLERTTVIISDLYFNCNTNMINKAFKNQTYAYEFQVPPAFHGGDVRYTFYTGADKTVIPEIAHIQQEYFANFIKSGDPNGEGLFPWPMQGKNASMIAWNSTTVGIQVDPTINDRCAFWQSVL
jgi:carboxylesterase type B